MVKLDERVPTFIPGYDKLISGGFLKKSVNLFSGGPGTGKSIFCLQYLYYGLTKANQKGLYISFEEDINELKLDAKSFGWDFEEYEKKGMIKFIYLYPYEVTNLHSKLVSELTKFDAKRVVIDSTSTFGMALEGEYEIRKELYALASHLKRFDCSSILTSEIINETNMDQTRTLSRFGVEEFIADSVTTLHYLRSGTSNNRAIRVVKMRRTNNFKGALPFTITPKGIQIDSKPIDISFLKN